MPTPLRALPYVPMNATRNRRAPLPATAAGVEDVPDAEPIPLSSVVATSPHERSTERSNPPSSSARNGDTLKVLLLSLLLLGVVSGLISP